jgi:hypothetical protein
MQGLRAILFDLLLWFRGDMRFGTSGPNVSLTAGNAQAFFIEPPVATEEWEILFCQLWDSAKIDAADIATFGWRDEQIAANITLQETLLAATSQLTSFNFALFPNRRQLGTVQDAASVIDLFGPSGLIAQRKDNNAPWKRFVANYKATATIGTRTLGTFFIYRRRSLI